MHRTICKRCGNILKPSSSAELSMNEQNPNMCEISCNVCGIVKRFMVNPNYNLWFDNPQSVVNEIRFCDDKTDKSNEVKSVK